jgi:hypothetical protein
MTYCYIAGTWMNLKNIRANKVADYRNPTIPFI